MTNKLNKKHILLGISGSLAAYKTPELIRRLQDQGAIVSVIVTESALQFVSKMVLQSIVAGDVICDNDILSHNKPMQHIDLVRNCDCYLLAPASANTIAHISYGLAGNVLCESVLACEKPILIAPSMNHSMWLNKATQKNIAILNSYGYSVIPPDTGSLGCGEYGPGRLASNDIIITEITRQSSIPWLKGKNLCITAGPTCEDIDPIRYITNRSSGRMGFELAKAAYLAGANVCLISGPTQLPTPHGCDIHQVRSANDMFNTVKKNITHQDIFIATAAVADYTPTHQQKQKIKKSNNPMQLQLTTTQDILQYVSKNHPKIYSIGFAAETNNLIEHATNKLKNKQLNAIVANHVGHNKSIGQRDNQVTLLFDNGTQLELSRNSKSIIAQGILYGCQKNIIDYFKSLHKENTIA